MTSNKQAQVAYDNEQSATADDMYNSEVYTTVQVVAKPVKVGKGIAHNAPKPNATAVAQVTLATVASGLQFDGDKLSPFGHKAHCQNGLCDNAIVAGHCTTAFALLYHVAVVQRNEPVIAALYTQYQVQGQPANVVAVIAHLARRYKSHIAWCGNTVTDSYGGFASRLQKTGACALKGDKNHLFIAKLFATISDQLPLFTNEQRVTLAIAQKQANK